MLTRTEQELLLQIEPDLRTARLEVDLDKELGYNPDDKRQEKLVILRVVIGLGVGRIRPRLVEQSVERSANEFVLRYTSRNIEVRKTGRRRLEVGEGGILELGGYEPSSHISARSPNTIIATSLLSPKHQPGSLCLKFHQLQVLPLPQTLRLSFPQL